MSLRIKHKYRLVENMGNRRSRREGWGGGRKGVKGGKVGRVLFTA